LHQAGKSVVRINSEVAEVRTAPPPAGGSGPTTAVGRVTSRGEGVTDIVTKDGAFYPADIIVSNMEVIPAYERLLRQDKAWHSTI
jgi:hypothetical protein